MTKKPLGPIHAKCKAVRHGSPTLLCHKSPEHVDSEDPKRQRHHDTNNEIYWTDNGEEESADA